MRIRSIRLENFRNYENQTIPVQSGINVLYGSNAQGKTNVLEAIYLCACARSHRTSRDQDLIRHQADQYQISLSFENEQGYLEEIVIRYLDAVPGDPLRLRPVRQIFHNGVKLDRVGEMMGLFHAVIFAPEDLMLVKEGPATRRRYLDLLITQLKPTYFQDLQLYVRLLAQRNKLLKTIREDKNFIYRNKSIDSGQDQDTETEAVDPMFMQLDIWDQSLARCAARLIHVRFLFTGRIAKEAEDALTRISSGKEKLSVNYKTVSGIKPEMGIEEIAVLFEKKLKTMINEDVLRGNTGLGPHRDDLEILLNGELLKPYASQGQQRSVVLSLKMAELAIIREEIQELPVLLLDDVMSELDLHRRNCLLSGIDQAQVFVTCTDRTHVLSDFKGTRDEKGVTNGIQEADINESDLCENNYIDYQKWNGDRSRGSGRSDQYSFYEVVEGYVHPQENQEESK